LGIDIVSNVRRVGYRLKTKRLSDGFNLG
jgi:hypothetical protein